MAEDLNRLLNESLDGALDEVQRAQLDAKLKQQPALARRLERMRGLRAALRDSAPVPDPAQSARMWAAIRERVAQPEAARLPLAGPPAGIPEAEPWYAFLSRPWIPAWGLGFAGAAAALALVLLIRPHAPTRIQPATPAQARSAAAPASPQVSAAKPRIPAPAPAAAEGPAPARVAATQPAAPFAASRPVPTVGGPTEVERALADNQVDAMIDQFLQARQQSPSRPALGAVPASPDFQASYSGGGNAATNVGYQTSAVAAPDLDAGPRASGGASGSKDANGFWDWNPTATALNRRDWSRARVELEAASQGAGAASERAFADSALTLLSAPGAPLEGSQPFLPSVGDLRVLGAGRWQLQVDSRVARFSQGVSARLPGFRVEGNSLLLDLTFDRATFAPGARFVRISGENAARVVDAANQPVSTDDFYAPSGADYNIPDRELRLR